MSQNAGTSQSYYLRLPPEIKEKLSDAAQQNFRSLNSEILKRLADSLSCNEKPEAA